MSKLKITRSLSIVAMVTVVTVSFAQGPQNGGEGFPPPSGDRISGNGPSEMRARPPRGPESLLTKASVIKELKLTDEQIKKIKALMQRGLQGGPGMGGPGGPGQGGPGMQGGPGGPGGPDMGGQGGPGGDGPGGPPDMQGGPGQGGPGGGPGGFDGGPGGPGGPGQGGPGQGGPGQGGPGQGGPGGRGGQNWGPIAAFKSILDAKQFARFKQLILQFEGPIAITRDREVGTALNITEDQNQQIRKILDANRPKQSTQSGGGRPTPPSAAQRKAIGDKILAILTDSQKSKWESLQGDKFDLSSN